MQLLLELSQIQLIMHQTYGAPFAEALRARLVAAKLGDNLIVSWLQAVEVGNVATLESVMAVRTAPPCRSFHASLVLISIGDCVPDSPVCVLTWRRLLFVPFSRHLPRSVARSLVDCV